MNRMLGLFLISVIGYSTASQSIGLFGKVLNKSNKPVPGAIITLAGKQLSDTTDADGAYSLVSGTFLTNPAPLLPRFEKMSLTNGIVSLCLTKPAPVSIEMFDMKGNLLKKVIAHPAFAGDYQFDVMTHQYAANMMVIRVSIGQSASTFRHLPLNNGQRTITSSIAASATGRGLARLQAIVDSLKVTAAGYLANATAISSYQGQVNITLDTISMKKFSFFVTSLKGLQTLSGSEKGFGGNLSFGKKGQGAGLLGADSICQCLAEKSMPGSKVKLWRAFLSVAKDANGQRVNAIDRIGKGPWYDRLGRLVSNAIGDLLHDRPNADAAIKNDLPNEDGVPNHQPDPNKTVVDNHQFITGSDSTGKLYSDSSTCKDWTYAAGDTNNRPRCGLSWPKVTGWMPKAEVGPHPKNFANWISVWDLWGCEPGLDLTETSQRGSPGIYTISNGGGYGGFYCFALNP
jgi:hypothetical protein